MSFQNQSFSRSQRRNMASSHVRNSVQCGLCLCTTFYPVKLNKCVHHFCYQCVWSLAKHELQRSMTQRDDDDDEPWIPVLEPSCPHCDKTFDVAESLFGTSYLRVRSFSTPTLPYDCPDPKDFADNGWYYATDFRMEFENPEPLEYLGKPHMIVRCIECQVQEKIRGLPISLYQQRHSPYCSFANQE
jgi:hypothetical protein